MTKPPSAAFTVALASITLIGPLAVHLFLPAIPVVKQEFGISDALAQSTFSVALMGMAFSTLFYGSLADRFGRRPVLLSGLMLFLVGSALSAYAPNIELLVGGRLVQAAGAGCGITLVRAIARDTYGQAQLVKAIAYLTMFYTMGPTLAPIVGGLLIDAYGWRTLFAFAIVAGAGILLAAALFVPETRPQQTPAPAGENTATVYLDLFSRLRFNAFVFQTGFSTGSFFVTATAAAFIMKETLHRPATEYGLYFAFFPVGFLLGNLISSRLSGRVAIETMVLAGSLVLAIAVVAQIAVLNAGHVTPLTLCLPGFFITLGQGIALPSGQAGAMATAPRHAGTAAGIGVFVQMLIGGLAVQVYGLAADGSLQPFLFTSGLCAVITVIVGSIPFLMTRSR